MTLDDNPTSDVFDKLTYPKLRNKDFTLDMNDLARHCHLDNHRVSKAGLRDLGKLDDLPLELLHIVFVSLDVQIMTDFRQVNRRASRALDGLPQYASMIKFAPNVIRGMLSIETGRYTTCLSLYNTLCTWQCESCGDFGGYIYLITCKRVCFLCMSEVEAYLPLSYGLAKRRFGLSYKTFDRLPHMTSQPGIYSPGQKRRPKRFRLVDYQSVYDCWREKLVPQMLDAAAVHLEEASAHPIQAFVPKQNGPFDAQQGNALRFMAIVQAPQILHQSGSLEFGAHCAVCKETEAYKTRPHHFRRRYTRSSFAAHMLELHPGRVVSSLFCS